MKFGWKNKLRKKSHVLTLVIIAILIYQQFPTVMNNLAHQEKFIKSRNVRLLNKHPTTLISFPPKSRAIAIFWASWCGPCKIEMKRLKSSVDSGAIPKKAIYAINPFETDLEVTKYLENHSYPFTFIEFSSLSEELGISATPTTIFLEDGIVTEMTSGMSIWGIWKAEHFL